MTILSSGCTQEQFKEEIQITHDFNYNHDLDNNDNFSPDDQWLVYDTRIEEGAISANAKIEKVNLKTGEKVVLYELPQNSAYGPGVGAVSYSPTENKVVFIHGLLNCSEDKPYEQWRRTGVIIDESKPGVPIFMDARDLTTPYTPGALRGGTHRHEWSGDGTYIGFTYNDAVLKALEDSTGITSNLRTIGVSKKGKKVTVEATDQGENFSGEWFSVLVVSVVPDPKPGTDEISRAAGDSWVGTLGYKKTDDSQQMARGFIGTVKDKDGNNVDEVFLVDIPSTLMTPNGTEPLEGTATTFPAPPKGAAQRRLTHTATSKFPGCEGIVRSSSDGELLGYLAFDTHGIKQVFTISPLGGNAVQQTFHPTNVESGVRWHPTEHRICYVWNKAIISKEIGKDEVTALTASSENPPHNLVWSHDGNTIAYNKMVTNEKGETAKQIFIIDLK
ncbi:MAG: DUF3748 domain-containing protein [Flavobacteriaceae bacterium]